MTKPKYAQPVRHRAEPSALWGEKELSGVEYDRAVRIQDKAFLRHPAEAYERGEFPAECYPREAA